MIKRKRFIVSIIALVVICAGAFLIIYNAKQKKVNAKLNEGILALNSKNYSVAKDDMNSVLKQDNNNAKAKEVINMINDYENGQKDLKAGNLNKSINDLNALPEDYQNYAIKTDIEHLKNEITTKKSSINTLNDNLKKISSLIDTKHFNQANAVINSTNTLFATADQKKQLDSYAKIVSENLQKETVSQVDHTEKASPNIEDQAVINSINATSRQATPNTNTYNKTTTTYNKKTQSNTTPQYGASPQYDSNIYYPNSDFGLTMTFPANWRDKYVISENSNCLTVSMKINNSAYEGQGVLFYIFKGSSKDYMLDSSRIITNKKGEKFTAGTPTDMSCAENNPQFKEWKSMNMEVNTILNSITA